MGSEHEGICGPDGPQFLSYRTEKVSFAVPADAMLIPPLAINDAAPGAKLSAFREVMNYESLMLSFSVNSQYEAAGTVWMLDPTHRSGSDSVSITQLESAIWMWGEDALRMSSPDPLSRRYSFDVPLPARVLDPKVA